MRKCIVGALLLLAGTQLRASVGTVYGLNPPTQTQACTSVIGGITYSITTPLWTPSNITYLRDWVQPSPPNGHFYKNIGADGPVTTGLVQPVFPTVANSTVLDSNGIIWQEQGTTNAPGGKNSECFDEYMNILRCGTAALNGVGSCTHPIDGLAIPLGWGADGGASQSTNPGFETSTGCPATCASAGYSYANVDTFVNRYANDAFFPAAGVGGDLTLIVKPMQNGSNNVFTPYYVFGQTWATAQSAAVQDVSFGPAGGVPGSQCGTANLPVLTTANITTMTGGTASDQLCTLATGFPAAWYKTFYVAWENAISNSRAYFKNTASYRARVKQIRFGLARGGENFPANSTQLKTLASPGHDKASLFTQWTTYDQTIYNFEAALGLISPTLEAAFTGGCNGGGTGCDVDYTFPDQAATYADAAGISIIQDNGATLSDISLVNTWCNPNCPAGKGYSNDFAFIWQTYPNRLANIQTVAPSDPTGNGTGSLAVLLPFYAARNAHFAEIFKEDILLAYDPNYTSNGVYGSAYATAIFNFRNGTNPPISVPAQLFGVGRILGNGNLQTAGSSFSALDENAYCSPGDIPNFGTMDGPAFLPQSCVFTALSGTPSAGTVHSIATAADLTNCFAGSITCPGGTPACGDIFSLASGGSFVGNFTLAAWATCDAAHWLRIQTSAVGSLTPEHVRINPSYAGVASLPGRPAFVCPGGACANVNVMAKIQSAGVTSNTAIALTSGDAYIRFIGIEITRPTGGGTMTSLVGLNNNHHIILDRVWGHGTSTDELRRFTDGNTANHIASVSGYYTDFHCLAVIGACTDSQVFSAGGSNPAATDGTYKWVNNFMEAAAENVEHGGGVASFTPCDEEYRLNHFFKPEIWNPADPSYAPVSGEPWIVKNLWETKNSCRVLIEGNFLEHNWGGFGQHAEAFEISPKNPSTNLCPTCFVSDTVIRYNFVREVSQFIGWVNEQASNLWAAGGVRGVAHDNIADGVMYANRNDTTLNPIAMLSGYAAANPPPAADVMTGMVMDHNSIIDVVPPVGMLNLHGPPAGNSTGTPQVANTLFTNSLLGSGTGNPLNGDGGGADNCATGLIQPIDIVTACWTGTSALTGNAVVVQYAGSKTWPAGNFFPASWAAVGLVNYNSGENGDYRLCTGVGTPDPACAGASPYVNAATNGTNIGANVPLVMTFFNFAY